MKYIQFSRGAFKRVNRYILKIIAESGGTAPNDAFLGQKGLDIALFHKLGIADLPSRTVHIAVPDDMWDNRGWDLVDNKIGDTQPVSDRANYYYFLAFALKYAYENRRLRLFMTQDNKPSIRVCSANETKPRDTVIIRLEDIYAEYVHDQERRPHQGGTHASPVRHSVQEHLRQLKDGRVVVVRSHERGSGERPSRITLT